MEIIKLKFYLILCDQAPKSLILYKTKDFDTLQYTNIRSVVYIFGLLKTYCAVAEGRILYTGEHIFGMCLKLKFPHYYFRFFSKRSPSLHPS